jgi:hypothetical protein
VSSTVLVAVVLGALAVALPGPTTVSAYRGTLAFSRLDPATHMWSLVLRSGDAETAAAVAPRSVPFDVDLGPDALGRTVAVYSRCARESSGDSDGAVSYPGGARGCRIYRYDPSARQERAIGTGYLPAIWHSTLAFARGDGSAALYARSSGRTRRLDDGGRVFCSARRPTECQRGSAVSYTGVDVAGSRVAVARQLDGIYDAPATQMTLTGVARRPVIVESRANGVSFRAMRFPALEAGRLYYAETCAGDPASCLQLFRRYRISTGALDSAPSPSLYLTGFSQTGRDAVFVRAAPDAWSEGPFEDACHGEPNGTCTLESARPAYR